MTLIPVEKDKQTIAGRFRKAPAFVFLDEEETQVKENPHKTSKSPVFFEYFKTLNIDKLYIKELGYKTLLNLLEMGVEVYLVEDVLTWDEIIQEKSLLLDAENGKKHCALGHHNKEAK